MMRIPLENLAGGAESELRLAPTPHNAIYAEGCARLLHFASTGNGGGVGRGQPILLVPSMIHRWYILDLCEGASMVAALCEAGFEVYCLDWGQPGDEDRYLQWDAVIKKVRRAVRRVTRRHGIAPGVLGYSMGATVAAIHAALEPGTVRGFVNLAGPIDFEHSGILGDFTDARWFDPEVIASAGNISSQQLQVGFAARRPTRDLARLFHYFSIADDPEQRRAFLSLQAWADEGASFPAAVYAHYIGSLYQRNELIRGEHVICGRTVSLSAIACPILVAVADDDTVCPPAAAVALCDATSSSDTQVLKLSDGHVGAVVGRSAQSQLYPALCRWFADKLCGPVNVDRDASMG